MRWSNELVVSVIPILSEGVKGKSSIKAPSAKCAEPFHTKQYADYDFLCRTFVQRLMASAKRTAQVAMTLNTVMAISFPDIQTPLGLAFTEGCARARKQNEAVHPRPVCFVSECRSDRISGSTRG